ncbi:hypothetical protein BH11MYX1_BH11MYX1_50370 [soil metagenome]
MKKLACVLVTLAACRPILSVESPAPPGRAARLDEVNGFWGLQSYRMELSAGVALALTCTKGSPCEHMKVVSDDPAIAEVRPASLGVLQKDPWGRSAQQTSAALVVVGKAPGTTTVHVRSKDGDRDVRITVVPPPT